MSMIKTELLPEQIEAVSTLPKYKRFLVADLTGLGKTLSLLASFDKVRETEPNSKMLVLCTKSALVSWKEQIEKWTSFSYSVLESGSVLSDDVWKSDIIAVTYPSLDTYIVALLAMERDYTTVLAIDECHRVKNPKADVTRSSRVLIEKSSYCWGATATPLLNHIEDLWGIFDTIFPGFLGDLESFLEIYTIRRIRKFQVPKKNFRGERVGKKEVQVKEIVGYRNLDKLKKIISPLMLRRERDMDIKFYTKKSALTPNEEKAYLTAAKGILDDTKEKIRQFAGRLPDLQLVVNNALEYGTYLLNRNKNTSENLSTKESLLLYCIQKIFERNEGCIVYTSLLLSIERLKYILGRFPVLDKSKLFCITGNSDVEERGFVQEQHCPGSVILMTDAGGESLNLQRVNWVIFYDLPFSLGKFIQVVGRIARVGSPYDVFHVLSLESEGTIDEYKSKLVFHHADLVKKVLSGKANLPQVKGGLLSNKQLMALKQTLLWRIHNAL